MFAIYKRELKSYLTNMIGCVFISVLLIVVGIFVTVMNLLYGYSMSGKNKHDDAPDAMAMLADFCQSFYAQRAEVVRRMW